MITSFFLIKPKLNVRNIKFIHPNLVQNREGLTGNSEIKTFHLPIIKNL